MENIKKSKRHGLEIPEVKINWEDAKKRKDMNVKILGMGLRKSLEAKGVYIIEGEGILKSKNEVLVKTKDEEKILEAKKIVLAIGTKPLFLSFMPKGKQVISSVEMLDLPEIPKSLVIIGGGVIGVEMASVFSGLGTEVMIIEKLNTLLPHQDREITDYLKKSLEKKSCKIYLNAEVLSAKDKDDKAEVIYKNYEGQEKTIITDKVLMAIGRALTYDIKEMEKIGIENDGRKILLNKNLQTTVPNIYMIGDSAFRNLTAYGAEEEGEMVASHILGKEKTIDYDKILVTVFSHPELAQIGLTEEKAKVKGIDYEVKKSEYAANGKAIILTEREGLAKIIVEKQSQKILGVHIIGAHATDLIHQALIPVMQEMTVPKWLEVVFGHPVLSEVLKNALES